MNTQIKEKWVNALRSGEYPQIQGNLRSPDGYCCLGVLCDLYAKEHSVEWTRMDYDNNNDVIDIPESQFSSWQFGDFFEDCYYFESEEGVLPKVVSKWAGLSNNGNPELQVPLDESYEETTKSLMDLNDSGISFSEIADLIEKFDVA